MQIELPSMLPFDTLRRRSHPEVICPKVGYYVLRPRAGLCPISCSPKCGGDRPTFAYRYNSRPSDLERLQEIDTMMLSQITITQEALLLRSEQKTSDQTSSHIQFVSEDPLANRIRNSLDLAVIRLAGSPAKANRA